MTLRVYFQQRGGHVHCRVFAGKAGVLGGVTLANVGTLVFGAEDWPEMQADLSKIAEVRDEDLHGTVKERHG